MYRNSRRAIVIPLVAGVCLAVGLLAGSLLRRSSEQTRLRQVARDISVRQNNKLNYTLSLIRELYVDPVDLDSIYEKVIPELVHELDPHSIYIPASEMAETNEVLDGEFDGIGVVFNMSTDTVIVLNVITGGPSDKAGVRNGDRIIKVGDSLIAGRNVPQQSVMKMLRGKRGTKVELSLQRQGIGELVPVTVERGVIPIKSLDAAFMLTPRTAFIKLAAFSKTSYEEIVTALKRLRSEGMENLIFDLRGNTGGFLDQAILIANEFLPGNRLIVYTEDKERKRVQEFSDGKGRFADMGLAVLIDEGSASSSEILAGAVQDNDRGTVIGRRSFGKGLVQRQIPYADGSALRLTTARYYTPTGRSIQKPYVNGSDDYDLDIVKRYENNEFFSADSIHFADSLRFTTPGGKTVYGGGGIMPDIFMPLDTTDITRYFVEVTGRNILYRYSIEYSDRHRARIDTVKTMAGLEALLGSDDRLLAGFVDYAASHGVAPHSRQIAVSRKLITAYLKAYIGRNTQLEDNGFYAGIAPIDKTVVRAVEVLESNAPARSGADARHGSAPAAEDKAGAAGMAGNAPGQASGSTAPSGSTAAPSGQEGRPANAPQGS